MMDKDDKRFLLIDNYLNGKLSSEEEAEVEAQLKHDEELSEIYALLRLEREMADVLLENAIEAKMKAWKTEQTGIKEPVELPKKKRKINWLPFVIVGLVVVLAGVFYTPTFLEEPADSPSSIGPQSSPRPVVEPPGAEQTPKADDPKEASEAPTTKESIPSKKPTASKEAEKIIDDQASQLRQLAMAQLEELSDRMNRAGRTTKRPVKGATLLERGEFYFQANQLDSAKLVLETISEEVDDYLGAQELLVYTYIKTKDFNSAIPILVNLLELEPIDEEQLRLCLGLAYVANSQEKAGFDILETLSSSGRDAKVKEVASAFLEEQQN
ncbi:MAG: hypothetical protein AAF798_01380 [Bacteroidota bacterium]